MLLNKIARYLFLFTNRHKAATSVNLLWRDGVNFNIGLKVKQAGTRHFARQETPVKVENCYSREP